MGAGSRLSNSQKGVHVMRNGEKRGIVIILTMAVFGAGYFLLLLTDVTNIRHLIDNIVTAYLLAWSLYGMFARLPLSEVGTRFLLTTSALLFCWIIAESAVLAGVIDYRLLLGGFEEDNPLSVAGRKFDKELLWRHEPFYHYEASYQGNLGEAICRAPDPARKVSVRYDEYGFRNSSTPDEADLVVIGDSYIEGYLTSEANLITTVLSALRTKPVINLGHSGYGPQQELLVLQRFGLPLKPKTIVWAFFEGNDFAEAEYYDKVVPSHSQSDFWQDFWFRSLTRNVAATMLRPARACVPNETIHASQAEFIDAENVRETVFFAPSELETPSDRTFHQVAATIAEAARLCRASNIRLVVAFIPEKFRVYHDLPNVSLVTETSRRWRVSDIPDRMRRLLRELDSSIEYIDLTPALKVASLNGQATYLPDDTHWTDHGNRVAAETIYRALLEKPNDDMRR